MLFVVSSCFQSEPIQFDPTIKYVCCYTKILIDIYVNNGYRKIACSVQRGCPWMFSIVFTVIVFYLGLLYGNTVCSCILLYVLVLQWMLTCGRAWHELYWQSNCLSSTSNLFNLHSKNLVSFNHRISCISKPCHSPYINTDKMNPPLITKNEIIQCNKNRKYSYIN